MKIFVRDPVKKSNPQRIVEKKYDKGVKASISARNQRFEIHEIKMHC